MMDAGPAATAGPAPSRDLPTPPTLLARRSLTREGAAPPLLDGGGVTPDAGLSIDSSPGPFPDAHADGGGDVRVQPRRAQELQRDVGKPPITPQKGSGVVASSHPGAGSGPGGVKDGASAESSPREALFTAASPGSASRAGRHDTDPRSVGLRSHTSAYSLASAGSGAGPPGAIGESDSDGDSEHDAASAFGPGRRGSGDTHSVRSGSKSRASEAPVRSLVSQASQASIRSGTRDDGSVLSRSPSVFSGRSGRHRSKPEGMSMNFQSRGIISRSLTKEKTARQHMSSRVFNTEHGKGSAFGGGSAASGLINRLDGTNDPSRDIMGGSMMSTRNLRKQMEDSLAEDKAEAEARSRSASIVSHRTGGTQASKSEVAAAAAHLPGAVEEIGAVPAGSVAKVADVREAKVAPGDASLVAGRRGSDSDAKYEDSKLNHTETFDFGDLTKLLATERKKRVLGAATASELVIDPNTPFMRRWDLIMVVMLMIVAILTPFEVAFLESKLNALFFINRLIDLFFLTDMIIQFFLPFQDANLLWVRSLHKIAKRYATGWFVLDFVSIFPFDVIGLTVESSAVSQLKAVRVVKLARLAKLARMFRVNRIFKRWETSMSINYSVLSLAKFAFSMLVLSHWLGCLWELTGTITVEPGTPLDEQDNWQAHNGFNSENIGVRWLTGVYWAVETLSAIGYGDITPSNATEQMVGTVAMLVGACTWAYIVGSVCGIVSTLDVHSMAHHQQMDELTTFMRDTNLAPAWRVRLREYFIQRQRLAHTLDYRFLLQRMSPMLRGETCLYIYRDLINNVSYFRGVDYDMATAIALRLDPAMYAPQELIPGDTLHIVERGLCIKDGNVLGQSSVWGEDMVLSNKSLQMHAPAIALTYVDVQALELYSLEAILEDFPERAKVVRRNAVWIALRRRVKAMAFFVMNPGHESERRSSYAARVDKKTSLDVFHTMSKSVKNIKTQRQATHFGVNSFNESTQDDIENRAAAVVEARKGALMGRMGVVQPARARPAVHNLGAGKGNRGTGGASGSPTRTPSKPPVTVVEVGSAKSNLTGVTVTSVKTDEGEEADGRRDPEPTTGAPVPSKRGGAATSGAAVAKPVGSAAASTVSRASSGLASLVLPPSSPVDKGPHGDGAYSSSENTPTGSDVSFSDVSGGIGGSDSLANRSQSLVGSQGSGSDALTRSASVLSGAGSPSSRAARRNRRVKRRDSDWLATHKAEATKASGEYSRRSSRRRSDISAISRGSRHSLQGELSGDGDAPVIEPGFKALKEVEGTGSDLIREFNRWREQERATGTVPTVPGFEATPTTSFPHDVGRFRSRKMMLAKFDQRTMSHADELIDFGGTRGHRHDREEGGRSVVRRLSVARPHYAARRRSVTSVPVMAGKFQINKGGAQQLMHERDWEDPFSPRLGRRSFTGGPQSAPEMDEAAVAALESRLLESVDDKFRGLVAHVDKLEAGLMANFERLVHKALMTPPPGSTAVTASASLETEG